MDTQRFDDLTKALARGSSRRVMLKSLVGVLAGGGLIPVGRRGR